MIAKHPRKNERCATPPIAPPRKVNSSSIGLGQDAIAYTAVNDVSYHFDVVDVMREAQFNFAGFIEMFHLISLRDRKRRACSRGRRVLLTLVWAWPSIRLRTECLIKSQTQNARSAMAAR